MIDKAAQRCVVKNPDPEHCADTGAANDAGAHATRIGVSQFIIPFRTEKGEGRDQGARTHTCHDFELGPLARIGHANDGAGTECATGTTA